MRNDDPHVKGKNIIKNDGNSLYEISNNKHVDNSDNCFLFYNSDLKKLAGFYPVIFLTI